MTCVCLSQQITYGDLYCTMPQANKLATAKDTYYLVESVYSDMTVCLPRSLTLYMHV